MSDLPINAVIPRLREALRARNAAVLQAPPGAGKTTGVPLALLDEPWAAGKRILMLEPRRLAARAAARRMAEMLDEKPGETVGYRVRLESKVGPKTRIEVLTEGILTRRLQGDPALEGVAAVLFDEFHERSLQADLGLALCLESQAALNEELKILVMSATLDGGPVAALLGDAPMITSEGRAYPVETRYLERGSRERVEPLAASAVRRALREEEGSLLVFLPGVGEIRRVEALLKEGGLPGDVDLDPLYGDLSAADQDRAIRPAAAGRRKIVLATAIAETSLTIEGIRIVIDGGLMRKPRFDPRSGMTRLETMRLSRASAEQRRGRAGRLEPGVCYRLWAEPEQAGLKPFSEPEIKEADLAPLTLELAQWGIRDAGELSWLDVPPAAAMDQARDLLAGLGALDGEGRITPHGRKMLNLPLHPRLAHMLIKGREMGLGGLACDLAALIEERDFLRLAPGQADADLRLRLEALWREGRRGGAGGGGGPGPGPGPSPGAGVDRGGCRRVLRQRDQLARLLGLDRGEAAAGEEVGGEAAAGLLLAFAYPDRIARRRPGGGRQYHLSNGRGAFFRDAEPLSAEDFLVVADLDGASREARIFRAAPILLSEIEEHFADRIEEVESVRWDGREGAVKARRQRRLGALVLGEWAIEKADPDLVAQGLLEGIRELGLGCLPWDEAAMGLRARVAFLRRVMGEDWPDWSDAALLDRLEEWLLPYLSGLGRREHLRKLDLSAILKARLDWPRQQQLDELAPTHVTVPSGSRIRIDYSSGETPVLPVRLQEMFGATDTPRLAGGRVALVLHLLSPAMRPLQVTTDLAGFWKGSYAEVKKDMKGRYPKHYWPDDPLQAEPTRRAKPRPS